MKNFEIEILSKLLSKGGLSGLCDLLETSSHSIDFSGAGYFLSIKDSRIPSKRIILSEPKIEGKLGENNVGFLAFIEASELTLECYSYGGEIVNNHRKQAFVHNAT